MTYAPGLIGALLVGVNFAKSAAYALGVPLIPVHHARGHIAANYITHPELEPPFVCLCVSGGNTMIVDVQDYTRHEDPGGHPGRRGGGVLRQGGPGAGHRLPRRGSHGSVWPGAGTTRRYELPRAHVAGAPLDMSFSGLKTAVLNLVHNAGQKGEELDLPGLAASFAAAVSDTLVPRTMEAAQTAGLRQGGGGRRGGGQLPHPGGLGAGLPPERGQALPARRCPCAGTTGP